MVSRSASNYPGRIKNNYLFLPVLHTGFRSRAKKPMFYISRIISITPKAKQELFITILSWGSTGRSHPGKRSFPVKISGCLPLHYVRTILYLKTDGKTGKDTGNRRQWPIGK